MKLYSDISVTATQATRGPQEKAGAGLEDRRPKLLADSFCVISINITPTQHLGAELNSDIFTLRASQKQKLFVLLTCHPLLALLHQPVCCVFPPAPFSVDHKALGKQDRKQLSRHGVHPQEMSNLWGNIRCSECPYPILSCLYISSLAS